MPALRLCAEEKTININISLDLGDMLARAYSSAAQSADDFLKKYKDEPYYERLLSDRGFCGLSKRGFDLFILDIELQAAEMEVENCKILGGNMEKKKAKFEKLTRKRNKLIEELTYYNFLDVAEG